MASALFWGFAAGSSLLVGALLSFALPLGRAALGATMAFGAGVLISAVSFELVDKAVETTDGDWAVALGIFTGAIMFFAGDWAIDNMGGRHRKSSEPKAGEGDAKAIVLGTVLDGIPESIVIGLSLVKGAGVSVTLVAAVFLSNVPEAVSSTTGLRASGWPRERLLAMWLGVVVMAGLSSLAGFALFDTSPDELIAFVQAFSAGALLTMLADTMMPQAFLLEGKVVGLFTTLGFAVAYAIGAVS